MKTGVKPYPVSAHTISSYSLPRTLKRPYFTFFRIITIVYVLALVAAAIVSLVSASLGILELTALIGSSLWIGFFMGVLFNWQSLTVFDDHLIFNSFGKKNTVFYRDVSEAKVFDAYTEGPQLSATSMLTLYLYHKSEAKNPLKINLMLYAVNDRALLLRLIKENGPHARLNTLAEKTRQRA